jgi:hypothetical protein
LLQYIITAVEEILCEYPGVSKTPYFVGLTASGSKTRSVVNSQFLRGKFYSSVNYDPSDEHLLLWYYKEYSMDRQDLQKLLNMCEQKKQIQSKNEDKATEL